VVAEDDGRISEPYKVGPGRPPREHQWKPGQSGNPGGRPKGLSITAALRTLLEKEHNGKTLAEILADRWMKDALEGKFPHLKELLDRTEGRPEERHEVTLPAPKPTFKQALEAYESLSDEEKIEQARAEKILHLLPPRLQELAAKRDAHSAGAVP
jgi:hypothetical protein